MTVRIGVDIGGTFTDLVIYDEAAGRLVLGKVPTTPASPERGCVEAVRQCASTSEIESCDYFLHGTTVGLNALLERRGATVGLLCTRGFRDTLEIRRGSRPEGYDPFWIPAAPLVPRFLRLPVGGRITAAGEILEPFDRQSVLDALELFNANDVGAIAVCLMNSYRDPSHELEVAKALRDAGYKGEISLSHQLSRDYHDYERTSTTCVDAFVRARMANYLELVRAGLAELRFRGHCLITRSGGGSMSFEEAKERAFETINSGPVAGAEGAAELSRSTGLGDLVTADVGGTSFDTSLILNGRAQLLYNATIAGMPVQAPWVDVRSIGAGGGSIAYIDAGGLLQVGPRSAGAQPGPACYGRGGTQPTVTDAAFYLGLLGNGRLASGLVLDHGQAESALLTVARPLRLSVQDAAIGILQIAAANMANAVREITIEQGVDPRKLKLLAFGGAGPMLATQIARELQMDHVVIPPIAGNFSAWGLLGADLVRSGGRTERLPLTQASLTIVNERITELRSELESRRGGFDASSLDTTLEVGLAMRFRGQEHSLTIPARLSGDVLADDVETIGAEFRAAYQRDFGVMLSNDIEIFAIRCALRKPLPRRNLVATKHGSGGAASAIQRVYSFAAGRMVDATTLRRDDLRPGIAYEGPAIVYEETTTTYVDADCSYRVDDSGCMHIVRKGNANA